jgi:Ran GTPase-activating protein (RanGAP) involved in mRNA processing and transport
VNSLGDDGVAELFRFLGTLKGRDHPIEEINLSSNNIGDTGLVAIATYLDGNEDLKVLFLEDVRMACLAGYRVCC